MNLSHNQISKIENLDYLINLNELNLKNNAIITVENLYKLAGKLEKLYLSNNKIDIKNFEINDLVKLINLK